jgi:hypothetical protein
VNSPHLFTHLKPATFYKARDFFVPLSEDPTSQLLKIALVLCVSITLPAASVGGTIQQLSA